MSRFNDLAEEELCATREFKTPDLLALDYQKARLLVSDRPINGPLTRWMTVPACAEYRRVLLPQLMTMQDRLRLKPDSLKSRIYGVLPHDDDSGSCWTSTQILSEQQGGYVLIGSYACIDKPHLAFDAAMQWVIGERLGIAVNRVVLNIGSLHSYRGEAA